MVLTRLLLPVLIYLCHRGLRVKETEAAGAG
jgi:hypothetical protein